MWSSKLFRRVFAAFALLIVLSAVLFGLLVARGQENELRLQLIDRLKVSSILLGQLAREPLGNYARRANDLANSGDEGPTTPLETLQESIRELGAETRTRLTLITSDGRVLADSELETLAEVELLEYHRNRPEFQQALRENTGFSERYSSTIGEPLMYFAYRVIDQGRVVGVARSALPVRAIRREVARARLRVVVFVLSLSAAAILGTAYLLGRIVNPILVLTRAVERMAAGQLGHHVDVANRDEIGMLARAINRLSDDLMTRIAQLRERGDQMAAVLGGMVEGVIAVDQRNRIMFANHAAGEQFGFVASEARGRPLLTLIRDETLHQSVRQTIQSRDTVNAEIRRLSPQGGTLALHATPLPGEPCPGVVVVTYDMTKLRRLEAIRQEFVANVSHELKTPLSSIKAYAETLLAGAINDDENKVRFVQRIDDQAERLHQLIMDLLSLARIESGDEAFEIDDVDIAHAVDTCRLENQPAAEAKSITLQIEPPERQVIVRADEEAVRQILDNLVNNAIKYTPDHGTITVRWGVNGSDALIEVADTGIGIDHEHQDRLFERFYRVDKARSRELGGTGLGLSIVKHLTQFFGGGVGVTSEVGEGSTFWVRLPLATNSQT